MQSWILNCAKVIGLSHEKDNIPCQDNVKTSTKNNVYVAVLSDGCGSAHFSEHGSKIVVDCVSEYICNNFDDLFKNDEDSIKREITNLILNNINKYIPTNRDIIKYLKSEECKIDFKKFKEADINGYLNDDDVKELFLKMLLDATTLFVATKEEKCLIGHCGDGFIVGNKNSNFEIISEEPKTGERNVTNYPSSIYYLSKAYKDESYWNLFRVIKLEHNDYNGFTLMSDGAEKSLISIKNKESTPVITNNQILFDILYNETPIDASNYLFDLLEKSYRERENNDGDLVEITDDDVSVAIMVVAKDNNVLNINSQNNEYLSNINSIDHMFYEKKLYKLIELNEKFDSNKFDYLDKLFRNLINEYICKPYDYNYFIRILKNKYKLSYEDIRDIELYAEKSGVIKKDPFRIVCSGGDSFE